LLTSFVVEQRISRRSEKSKRRPRGKVRDDHIDLESDELVHQRAKPIGLPRIGGRMPRDWARANTPR
jgi:hypothetical protein